MRNQENSNFYPSPSYQADHEIFSAPGEMASLMRKKDWSQTPVGPVSAWPQSLKVMIRTILASHYPMFVWWGPELTMFHNDAYSSVLGKKHPKALGQRAAEVWHDIWDVVGPMVVSVVHEGRTVFHKELELTMERYGYPEETYFTFSYSPIHDDQGAIGGLFCACSDETAQLIARRRLRLLRELAESVTLVRTDPEALRTGLEVLESDLRDVPYALAYLYDASTQSAKLVSSFGLEHEYQQSPESISLETYAPDNDPWALHIVYETGRPLIHSSQKVIIGRSRIPAKACVLPIAQSGTHEIAGFLVMGTSPQLAFDEDYQTFCELVGAQLATALATSRAYSAEKRRAEELREIDRAKTAFFSNVSHEFRTPLTLMLGPLEDILHPSRSGLPSEARTELNIVYRNGLRLLKLVNTLLDFSRIEAGRVQAHYEETDLAVLTTHLASVFRSAVEKAGMALEVHCESISAPVFVDRDMWEKIVLNLISNAFKYTLAGKIRVMLRDQGDTIELLVKDTGCGIPERELPHLFERFHRVEGVVGRTYEGSGIGLALVQELVKLHQGTVRVESTLGQGSTFHVSIPTGSAHLPLDQTVSSRRKSGSTGAAETFAEEALSWLPLQDKTRQRTDTPSAQTLEHRKYQATLGARILLADDNADMRAYVKNLLEPNWKVETARDGMEALSQAKANPPDLVLSDVMMPGLDGFGLVQALRADPVTSGIPIILLSARAGEESRVEGMDIGADDYLTKPFNARELLARVGSHLQMARFREEANASLRESEERFRARTAQFETLLNQAPLGVYLIDADFCFRAINPVARPVFSSISNGVIGRDFSEIIHILWDKDTADEFVEIFRRTLETGESYIVPELKERRADSGEIEYYEWRIDRIPLPDGRWGVVCYFRDISQQVLAREAVEESGKRLRFVMESMPQKIFITSATAELEYMNRFWLEFTGRSIDDMKGSGWMQSIHETDVEANSKAWEESTRTGSLFQFQHRLRRADGEYRWHITRATPMRDDQGKILMWIGSSTDIHDLKMAEESLKEADRRKDEFLAVLSHELRSPLNVISGNIELLRYEEAGSAEFEESLDAIERHAAAQAQLISDLLDVSRIITGKLALSIKPFLLSEVLMAALDTVRFAAENKMIHLDLDFDLHSLGLINGDETRIQQVIWNLLTNAVKFTPQGGRIRLHARRQNSRVEVAVSDNGQGITPDFLSHVFDRFHQEDASNTRRYGGLGLGLSIVRHIVEMHGGTVEARSEGKGQGATFIVRLPVHDMASEGHSQNKISKPSSQADSHSMDNTQSKELSGYRILIIDDQWDARDMLARGLRKFGAELSLAASAEEGRRALQGGRFSLLVCDIGMPGLNGFDFIKQWRNEETSTRRSPIPAVALTAYASDKDQKQAYAAGFQRHMAKPVKISELVKVITDLGSGFH
jgi:PAS domain S-box-containing protein